MLWLDCIEVYVLQDRKTSFSRHVSMYAVIVREYLEIHISGKVVPPYEDKVKAKSIANVLSRLYDR